MNKEKREHSLRLLREYRKKEESKIVSSIQCSNCKGRVEYSYHVKGIHDVLWSIHTNCTDKCRGWFIGFYYNPSNGEFCRGNI